MSNVSDYISIIKQHLKMYVFSKYFEWNEDDAWTELAYISYKGFGNKTGLSVIGRAG